MNADFSPIAADDSELESGNRARLDGLTYTVIGAAQKVSRVLGTGFVEKVYENALRHELRHAHVHVQQQQTIQVRYDGIIVGNFVTDLLVEKAILVELKSVPGLDQVHHAQCINYLKATGLRSAFC